MTGSSTSGDAAGADDAAPSLAVVAVTVLPTLPILATASRAGIALPSAVLVGGVGLVCGGVLFAVLHRLQLHRREHWVLAVATPIVLFGLGIAVVFYAVVRVEWAVPGILVGLSGGAWGVALQRLRTREEIDRFAWGGA